MCIISWDARRILSASQSCQKRATQLLQLRDDDIPPIIQAITSGKTLNAMDTEGGRREFTQFILQWDHLVVENRILYRQYEGSDGDISLQVVALKKIREEIMQQLHEGAFGAYLGKKTTL